jgi:hypothetical protein
LRHPDGDNSTPSPGASANEILLQMADMALRARPSGFHRRHRRHYWLK